MQSLAPNHSILALLEKAVGTEKLTLLASAIDQIRINQFESASGLTLDDKIETLEVDALAQENGVTLNTMRANICGVLGEGAVFRLGKRWVIRKQRYLDFLRAKEGALTEAA